MMCVCERWCCVVIGVCCVSVVMRREARSVAIRDGEGKS